MTYTKETLQEAIVQKLRLNYGCTEKQATDGEIMKACALVLRDIMAERGVRTREEVDSQEKRKVHYMSMEFLMGRSLMKNAYNLELLEPLTGAVEALGFKAADIFDMEPDAGLGPQMTLLKQLDAIIADIESRIGIDYKKGTLPNYQYYTNGPVPTGALD